jgi:tetratricopeptide (TPR) repeat protein
MRIVSRSFLSLCPLLMAALSGPAAGESLHGRLVDRSSLDASAWGKGIAGARISLFDASGRKLAVKTTGKLGDYRFAKLPPGTYTLSIDRKEYLPSPLLRVVTLVVEDTLSRMFTLDRIPTQAGMPVRTVGKKKGAAPDYYPRLAEGMLAELKLPQFHREAVANAVTLSRFFDGEDTTEAYRVLRTSLLWAELETRKWPVEAEVYLAHALDSALRAAGIPVPAAMRNPLKVSPDSVEAVTRSVRAMLVAPSKKDQPESIFKRQVPKAMVLRILEAHLVSKAAPKPRKKAFLAKIRNAVGPESFRKFALLVDPPKTKAAGKKKPAPKAEEPSGPPQPDVEPIWKLVREMSAGKRPNAVAMYHVATRRMEQGQVREALADFERMGTLRPDYPRAVNAMALGRLSLADTAGAERHFDSLTRMESPEWQARGFQGLAAIHWRSGRSEKAESALWRAMGLDTKTPAAREALILLAEVSLSRDSWNSVEPLLDSLIKTRPREADGHFWLGRMALKRQQDGVALGHFQKASALAPQRAEYAAAVAAAHFAREECEAALRILKPVRARLTGEGLSIYGQCLQIQGRAKEAVQEFQRLHSTKPSPQSLVQLARSMAAAGDGRGAVAAIQASQYTGNYEVRKALAAAQIDIGSAAQARQTLEKLAAEKEDDPELHFLRGKAAAALREHSEAGKHFTAALRYREDYPEAKYRHGLALLKLGRGGEARHYFLELKDSDKPSWRAKGLLGVGQAFAKEDKPEAAAENLRKSFEASASAEAAAHLALVCLRMKQPEEASAWADRARKLDPDEPLGLMAAVDALLARQRVDEAVAMARSGLDRHPEACDFMVVAAKAHLRAGHDGEARDLSQEAATRCPEDSAPYFYLGTLAARAGTVKEARRHFGEYLRTGGEAKKVPEGYR